MPVSMSIENDIKQEAFTSEYHKALVNILYTHNYLIHSMNKVFKKYGVTRQQFNVLRIIRGNQPEPSNINLIKDRMIDKMSDASRIVERLKIKGLVVREVNRLDRRSVDILITDEGLELLSQMDQEFDLFELPLKNLKESEAQELNSLLDKIRVS